MAFLDLGNPLGVAAAGSGAEVLAQNFDCGLVEENAEDYARWVESTCTYVAPECGARAVKSSTQPDGPEDFDDFGQLRASHAGSGSI